LKQRKVHKAVIIPMIDYVPEILEKYNYDLPKIPSYKFNERLKELVKKAKLKQKVEIVRKKGNLRVKEVHEKWEMMSSHTCRRSFCTNMYLSGFPAEELMRIYPDTKALRHLCDISRLIICGSKQIESFEKQFE
jgi:hypothetical protein